MLSSHSRSLTSLFENAVKCSNGFLGCKKSIRECNENFTMTTSLNGSRKTIQLKSIKTNLMRQKYVKYSDEFIAKQVQRFNLGKRRLANMMGEDPESYTDDDVKKAIHYLLPSELDEKALPSMEHPSNVYTSRIKIHWDENRRPHHYLYYTRRPIFFELLHQIYQKVLDVRKIYDSMDRPVKNELDLSGSRWFTREELESEVDEQVIDIHYRQFLAQVERLVEEPYAFTETDFIMKYRKPHVVVSLMGDVKETERLSDGRMCVWESGQKKTAFAEVQLISPGKGEIIINDIPILHFFRSIEDRYTVITPLNFLGLLRTFDIIATVDGGWNGTARSAKDSNIIISGLAVRRAAQACAIRHALARALRSFVSKNEVEMLRRAGLLTQDIRYKERHRPGFRGARKKPTWKRR